MRRAVWFEPCGLPGVGLRAVEIGPAPPPFSWMGMRRIIYRDFDQKSRRLSVWPNTLIDRANEQIASQRSKR